MASLPLCPAPRSIGLGFQNRSRRADSSSCNNLHLLPLNLLSTRSTLRFRNAAQLLITRRLSPLHASSRPSEGPIEKSEGTKGGDESTAKGPPFLTILAGFLAFAIVVWIIGSIVSWLIGLVGLIFSK